jgi:hypothetical protein
MSLEILDAAGIEVAQRDETGAIAFLDPTRLTHLGEQRWAGDGIVIDAATGEVRLSGKAAPATKGASGLITGASAVALALSVIWRWGRG